MYRPLIAALVAASCALCSPQVLAQEKRSVEELERLSQEGMALAGKGDFEGAIRIWEDILDEVPTGTALELHVNIGVAYQRLKKLPEAWYHLDRYVRGTEVPDREVAREARKLAKKLASSRVKTSIGCTPEGTTLYFGEKADGTPYPCPISWYLPAGKHSVYVTMEGHEAAVHTLTVDGKNKEAYLKVKLDSKKVRHGTLIIEGSARTVQVFLNGELEGSVPFRRKLKPGTYEVMVGPPGKLPWKKRVTINAGQTVEHKPTIAMLKTPRTGKNGKEGKNGRLFPVIPDGKAPPPKVEKRVESDSSFVAWTVAGSGGALLAAGLGCALVALSREGDLQDKYPADQSLPYEQFAANQQDYSDAYNEEVYPLGVASYVLMGVGAAAALTGGVLFALGGGEDKAEGKPAAALYPVFDGNTYGLGVSLDF